MSEGNISKATYYPKLNSNLNCPHCDSTSTSVIKKDQCKLILKILYCFFMILLVLPLLVLIIFVIIMAIVTCKRKKQRKPLLCDCHWFMARGNDSTYDITDTRCNFCLKYCLLCLPRVPIVHYCGKPDCGKVIGVHM